MASYVLDADDMIYRQGKTTAENIQDSTGASQNKRHMSGLIDLYFTWPWP
jgi:hypothetical protein